MSHQQSHQQLTPLFNFGMPSNKEMTYSLILKPESVTITPIRGFDFQTEDDYSDQMEDEVKWINNRQRLEEQNSDTKHTIKKVTPNPNQNNLSPQQIANYMNYMNIYNNYYNNYYTQNRVPFSPIRPHIMAQNNLPLNSLKQTNSLSVVRNEPKNDF